jgi:hypothetical protein
MNIQEAITSGKHFKRREWSEWLESKGTNITYVRHGYAHTLSPSEIMADDWEVKKDPREYWLVARNGINSICSTREEAQLLYKALSAGKWVVPEVIHVREVGEVK